MDASPGVHCGVVVPFLSYTDTAALPEGVLGTAESVKAGKGSRSGSIRSSSREGQGQAGTCCVCSFQLCSQRQEWPQGQHEAVCWKAALPGMIGSSSCGPLAQKSHREGKRHVGRKRREQKGQAACCQQQQVPQIPGRRKNRSTPELESRRYPGSLNRYKTALKKHRKLGFKVKVVCSPKRPSVPQVQAWARVPSCPRAVLPSIAAGEGHFLASAWMLNTDLWGLEIVPVIWLPVHKAISHWNNVSSA